MNEQETKQEAKALAYLKEKQVSMRASCDQIQQNFLALANAKGVTGLVHLAKQLIDGSIKDSDGEAMCKWLMEPVNVKVRQAVFELAMMGVLKVIDSKVEFEEQKSAANSPVNYTD